MDGGYSSLWFGFFFFFPTHFPKLCTDSFVEKIGQPEVWAITLSEDGRYLVGTTDNGHVKVWDLDGDAALVQDFETKGNVFGTCVHVVRALSALLLRLQADTPYLVCGRKVDRKWSCRWWRLHVPQGDRTNGLFVDW